MKLRPNCECCDKDPPNDSVEARFCTFECTFCSACAADKLKDICPNCGGELLRRPRRPAAALLKHPQSTKRVYKPLGCLNQIAASDSEGSTQAVGPAHHPWHSPMLRGGQTRRDTSASGAASIAPAPRLCTLPHIARRTGVWNNLRFCGRCRRTFSLHPPCSCAVFCSPASSTLPLSPSPRSALPRTRRINFW